MDKYICECCGGKINPRTLKCEYCDTEYKREGDDIIRIETFRNPVVPLKCGVSISREMLMNDPERTVRYVYGKIAEKLADSIMPYMIFENHDDVERCQTQIVGMIRVVNPEVKPTDITERLRRIR